LKVNFGAVMISNVSRREFGLAVLSLSVLAKGNAEIPAQVPNWVSKLRRDLQQMAIKLNKTVLPWHGPKHVETPEDHGFSLQGLATASIQAAINSVASKGGGTVRLAKGDYISGTIDLKSNIRLEVAEGARLLASLDLKDWPDRIAKRRTVMDTNMGMNQSLIFAEGCKNISLAGKGTIDGRGAQFKGEETIHGTPGRPFLIRVIDCENVHVTDLTMLDSPCWMQNYLNCDNVLIEKLRIENQANFNNDGCDIDGCRNVIVRNCTISSGDDSLCFKGSSLMPAENILVEHCTFFSSCNAVKLGTDSQSLFRNVLVRNMVLGGVSEEMRRIKHAGADSAISWEIVDGGTAENLLTTDIHVVRAFSPLFMRIDDRGRVFPEDPKPAVGKLRRVVFENITGENNGPRGSYFLGMPGHPIEDVVLHNVRLGTLPTSKPALNAGSVPEMHGLYPDAHMIDEIGDSPAAGLWARHIKGLELVDCRFDKDRLDVRPEVIIEPLPKS
jgi:polygalacturonase